jgi:dTDP-4-dehydrorhamnose reductase
MSKTMLILGASGLTGYKAFHIAKSRCQVYGTYNMRTPTEKSLTKLNITREEEVRQLLHDLKPDVVLNTTALHNVDYCETHQDEAYLINSKVVGMIAQHCNNLGARLVHISTDFVFDGKKGSSYSETDIPNPLSVYGKSKLEGEILAKKCNSYAILRTSVVYGWTPLEIQGTTSSSGKPQNFALWALMKMSNGEELKIVDDQYSSPTLADILASIAVKLGISEKNDLYHVAGIDSISRHNFTLKLAEMMGYSDEKIKSISSKSFPQVAQRPANSSLDCSKIQKELHYKLLDIDESLAVMRSQIELESPALLGNI